MSEQFLISLYFFLRMILYGCKLACAHDVTKPANKKTVPVCFLIVGSLGFVIPTVVCIITYFSSHTGFFSLEQSCLLKTSWNAL